MVVLLLLNSQLFYFDKKIPRKSGMKYLKKINTVKRLIARVLIVRRICHYHYTQKSMNRPLWS